jgi:hypothetical protein
MVLVVAARLWCSLSVQGADIRVQAMRFALLIVLTIALASVAVRINSHSSSSASKHHGASPVQSPALSSPSPARPQSSPPQSPSVQPTHATRPPRTAGHGGAASGPAGGGVPAELPVSGWDPALKLGALAFVLIGSGLLTIRAAGPRPRQRLTVQD